MTRPDKNLRKDSKIIVTGAAGLIGQNLCLRLHKAGYTNIWGYDKHALNSQVLQDLQPYVRFTETDLAETGSWQADFGDADIVILNQAQIGGLNWTDFERNNVTATENILAACEGNPDVFIINISSSVVRSKADDFYTRSKTRQEEIVTASSLPHCTLRPTLMFGWFDRKHLGWLRRFMEKAPVFPVPGHGRYIRQPLYAGDFCDIITACMSRKPAGQVFDISGQEKLTYIDLIRTIKKLTGNRTPIVKVPYGLFYALIWLAGKVMRDPPFTTAQLEALVIPEEFPVIDWPSIFDVQATSFEKAVRETFTDPDYSNIVLDF